MCALLATLRLSTFTSDLPVPVLSQILGMHVNTAVDWGKYVKRAGPLTWAHVVATPRTAATVAGADRGLWQRPWHDMLRAMIKRIESSVRR